MKNQIKVLLTLGILVLFVIPMWGFESKPKFSIGKTSDTPSGAGMIYGYRGGGDATTNGGALYLEGDKLKTGITGWVAAETGMDLAEMTIKQTGGSSGDYNSSTDANNRPDGYKVLDRRQNNNGDGTVHILHMYYYAKPNPGYEYVGWYSDEAGTTAIAGSTNHYPYPQSKSQVENSGIKTFTPKRWDNGDGSTLPAKGPYSDFYYLRDAQEITKNTANAAKTVYVKFRIIPRHVVFVGTGFADVSYTAGGTNVGATNVESGNITGNIALNITYDANKYNFNGWQWSLGPNGSKTDIASTASATYTFVVDRGYPTATYNSTTGGYDYGAYTKVYIQPLLTEKVDYVAEVTHNEVTTSYGTWDAAFAAAKATGVSGAVITLKKDVADITTEQAVDRNMTLNLNGHTLTGGGTNSYLFTVSGSGKVFTLCDNTPAAAGRIVYNTSEVQYPYAIGVKTGAKLQIASGGVSATSTKSDGSSRGVEIQAGGTLEMTGGSVEAQSLQNAYAVINRGTATISGGDIYGHTTTAATAVGFYNVGTSATITGGTFRAYATTTKAYGIQHNVASKTLTINYAISTATAGESGAVALQRSNGKILVKGGKYKASSVLNTANKSSIELQGGIYSTWTNVRQSCATGYDCYELQPGADWNDGYRFEVIAATANPRVCKILEVGKSTSYYTSLSDALTYANNNTGSVMSIILIAFEHTLPAGNYTLPQRADLVVPYSVDQTGVVGASPVRVASNSTPSAFRKLTLASGVNIDAFGKIEAGGRQSLSGTGANGAGIPSGAYGWLVLQNGSKITLENGSQLSAWGFVTGSGEIDARRGSTVYEQFQMYGWMGGNNAVGMYSKTFPITQYFIQNVEAPVKYHPGARLITATGVYVSSTMVTTDAVNVIGVDGDVAMFLMANEDDSEDTWVRKRYDVATDRQVYEINSSARLGSLRITLEGLPLIGTIDMDSRNYTLPITNNMKIHLLTGEMGITQSTMMLAGTEIEVDKEATANIASGQSLYLYDDAEWGTYAFQNALAHRIKYRPEATPNAAKRDISSAAALGDAKLFVHGTFDVKGSLYTTSTGSNIYSTNEDAGTIKFTTKAASSNSSMTMYSGDGSATTDVAAVPALLRNGDNSTTATSGTAAGKSFAYSDGKWQCWTQEGCFFVDNTNTYYAKPADYVALLNGKTENADHTYTSKDGTRTFILVDGCQWWEVEIEDADAGVWHCVHPLNDVYYYHNGTTWVVKTVSVTWLNWNGSVITTYNNVPYKSTPVYNSTTPTRTMDAYYTYDFAGWSPALSPVTSNTSFTAQFTSRDRKYTIVFKNEDGSVRETKYCTMGQIPVCTNPPTKTGFRLVWSPTIEAVTGDATYTATFTKEVQAAYHVTFKNYNNTIVLQEGDVTTGTMPVYSGTTPTKPATTDKTFTHNGWEPALHNVDADVIYTPTFSEAPREYTITWLNDDDSQIDQTHVAYGTLPTHADATKNPSGGYTYTFDGWTPAPVSVVGDATYKATYIAVAVPTYTLTVSATPAGYGTVSPSSVSDISSGSAVTTSSNTFTVNGTTVTATPTAADAQYTYSFDRWNNLPATVTGNVANIEAVFTRTINQYDVTFDMKEHGSAISKQTKDYGSKVDKPADPSEAGYTFVGWYKEDACTNAWNFASDEVTGATTLYAKWTVNSYTITFNTNGGSAVASITQDYGSAVTAPANPTKEGYTFNGWLPAVPATMPIDGATCVAQWTVNNYTISYDLAGGSVASVNPASYNIETEAFTLTNPTREGYTFAGWTGTGLASATTTVTIAKGSTGGRNYTATWTPVDYTISYDLAGGSATNPTSYTIETATFTLTNPTREGYTFAGWTGTGLASATTTVTIAKGSTGDRSYTATWTINNIAITWVDGNGVSHVADATYGTMPTAPDEAKVKAQTEDYSYEFSGWDKDVVAATVPTTYTAQFNTVERFYGEQHRLDIVDWSDNTASGTITLNMNGYSLPRAKTNWKVVFGETEYTKAQRDPETRLLSITGADLTVAGSNLTIKVYDYKEGSTSEYECVSRQHYQVPIVVNNTVALSTLSPAETSDVRVRNGATLTVDAAQKLRSVLVDAGSALNIDGAKLTVTDRIVLRTRTHVNIDYHAPELINNGTLTLSTGAKFYYSRIVADKQHLYPIGFPFKVDLSAVTLTNGTATRGTDFAIQYYDGESRAKNGVGGNWKLYSKNDEDPKTNILNAKQGYLLLSTSAYYREYLFPMTYDANAEKKVSVTTYPINRSAADAGWNVVVSPFTSTSSITASEPSQNLKISKLYEDNVNYYQDVARDLEPAVPFYLQVEQPGTLSFAATSSNIVRRCAHAYTSSSNGIDYSDNSVSEQWIRLMFSLTSNSASSLTSNSDSGLTSNSESGLTKDITNIFLHPTRFSADYETELDVVKLTTSGTKPLVYTSLTCGDLAFAAVPDDMAQAGLPITVNAPVDGDYLFSVEQGEYLERLDHLYLHDAEWDDLIDLLNTNYLIDLTKGVTRNRFTLRAVFRQPGIATDLDNLNGGLINGENGDANANGENGANGGNGANGAQPRKVYHDGYIYIILPNGNVYDTNGKRVEMF